MAAIGCGAVVSFRRYGNSGRSVHWQPARQHRHGRESAFVAARGRRRSMAGTNDPCSRSIGAPALEVDGSMAAIFTRKANLFMQLALAAAGIGLVGFFLLIWGVPLMNYNTQVSLI